MCVTLCVSVCKTLSTSHLASTYGPVEEESFRINFQVYQRRLCTVRLLGDNRKADFKNLQTHKIKVQEEKNTMCNSKQEPAFITTWVLLFIDLALNLMGYYVGTLSQHTVNEGPKRSLSVVVC